MNKMTDEFKFVSWTEVAAASDEYKEILRREKHFHPIIVNEHGTYRWLANEQRAREMMKEYFNAHDYNTMFFNGAHPNDPIVREIYRHSGYSIFGYWEVFYWEANNEEADEYHE